MAKPTGFLDYVRETPASRPPLERVRDWDEFHRHLDGERLRTQAARCMECGVPFCHAGRLVSGMATGCPLHNLIPEFNDLVYRGLWRQAWERLDKTSNFPEFTSRVCPALCEVGCTLGAIGMPPITVKAVEYAIIERAWAEGWVLPKVPPVRTGKRVAVVGSGPAGLAAAAQLNTAGHSVTVFERADRPGGLLMYGIPNMKLDKGVILRRVRLLEESGVKFIYNAHIGVEVDAQDILNTHDAVVLCTGSTRPRDANVEGRTLKGVHFAVDYLTAATKALLSGDVEATEINAAGLNVVVIGGGDTGNDCLGTVFRQSEACALTATRQRGRRVTQLEIMTRPPDTRQPDNVWPEWPKVLKVDYGQEEAIALREDTREDAADTVEVDAYPRRYCKTVKKFVGDANGHVREVVAVNVEWKKDASGRIVPVEVAGSEKTIPADIVLLAMGFLGTDTALLNELGVEADARGNIKAGHNAHRTNHPKIFAAGDCRRGQSLVVWAVNEGRAAARECDRFLMGYTMLP
ncbi:MAG: glutamate synthase subunit beta [Puniceicoccales bacterium]|jgi:glutamate synthase (NADPH/NADH) small chain|nr:glutamate synthase subunit beta [Puniceicoccales bacterium]